MTHQHIISIIILHYYFMLIIIITTLQHHNKNLNEQKFKLSKHGGSVPLHFDVKHNDIRTQRTQTD